jgi:kynurenine formamidase
VKRIVDLTATIKEDMIQNAPFHPRAPILLLNQRHDVTQWYAARFWTSPQLPPLFDGLPPEAGMPSRGHGQQSEQVIIGSHMGTHIDAPLHFDHGPTAGDAASIPLETCIGDAVVLDLRPFVDADDHVITITELDEAERRTGGRVRPHDIVLLNTGHAAKNAYGPDAKKANYAPTHPGLDYDTPPWFIERRVRAVGVDTANLDRDSVLSAHINFLLRPWIGKEPIYIIENLVRLEEIASSRFTFIGLPLPMVGASGSPIRAIAIVDQ